MCENNLKIHEIPLFCVILFYLTTKIVGYEGMFSVLVLYKIEIFPSVFNKCTNCFNPYTDIYFSRESSSLSETYILLTIPVTTKANLFGSFLFYSHSKRRNEKLQLIAGHDFTHLLKFFRFVAIFHFL